MSIIKKEKIVYILILVFSIIYLVHAFNSFTEAIVVTGEKTISLLQIFFTIAGLIYGSLGIIIVRSMWRYDIGKLFSFKLFLISFAIMIGSYDTTADNFFVVALFTLSNIFLIVLIGKVVELSHHQSFKTIIIFQSVFSILQLSLIELDRVLFVNYISTFLLAMIFFLYHYRRTSLHTKRQISALCKRLTVGIVLYIILSFVLSIELNISLDEYHEGFEVITELINHTNGFITLTSSPIPAIFFAFITFHVFNYLIEREYFKVENSFVMKKVIRTILYFSCFNLLLVIFITAELVVIYFLNIILLIPFIANIITENSSAIQAYQNLQALEEEKYNFAIYLHDEILQDIFALKYVLVLNERAEESMSKLIQKIRDVSHNLYPLVVENLGLSRSLQLYLDEINVDKTWEINYTYEYPPGSVPRHVQACIYRTVKELVTNMIKHAECSQIKIRIYEENNHMMTEVADNGKGFDVPDISTFIMKKSMGLASVYRQVANMKGEFMFQSKKGIGTTNLIKIPIEDEV